MDTAPVHPRIPHGEVDFRCIRLSRWLYLAMTRFLRRLEYKRGRSERFRRSESAGTGRIAADAGQATTQGDSYLTDERIARQFTAMRFTGLAVVFHGWKMVLCDAAA